MSILTLPESIKHQSSERRAWGNLLGASASLAIAKSVKQHSCFSLIITSDMQTAYQLQNELRFFLGDDKRPIMIFPDWETLPYDHFSPHQDIISERLLAFYQLPRLNQGILLAPVNTLMLRTLPTEYIEQHSFVLDKGDELDLEQFRNRLIKNGYHHVTQVMEHGEFTVRGSLIDLFPMGSKTPYRIDLFGNDVDSIRRFEPETQRTIETIDNIRMLPGHEFPIDDAAVSHFRHQWRSKFSGNPMECPIYDSISRGQSAAGIEYFLPLFYEKTSSLFDFLPENSLLFSIGDVHQQAQTFWNELSHRYDQLRHDITRPLLAPIDIALSVDELFGNIKHHPQITIHQDSLPNKAANMNFSCEALPELTINHKLNNPLAAMQDYLETDNKRCLLIAESAGRRETLLELLSDQNITPKNYDTWQSFVDDTAVLGISIAPLSHGFYLRESNTAIISESDLLGEKVQQKTTAKTHATYDPDAIVRNLTELHIGDPIVHIDHGVGRYLGLLTMDRDDQQTEFLTLEYADEAKLYVPVSSLNLISRYSGGDLETAPLNRLGSTRWEKAKRKAAEKIHDVAAELLEIYARRQMKPGHAYQFNEQEYRLFADGFPFTETDDQQKAITQVLDDMIAPRAMDRLVCGDVGFGKTEVAMRAAFMAVQNNKQVAMLAPTTLLVKQHEQSFKDRFADWPVQIAALSRFEGKQTQAKYLEQLKNGKIDIVIGTHKLLQKDIKFQNLGLLIIDEEHRFGVRQKEKITSLRAELDIVTLTATPIPRTLNMAMTQIRDLSIIATPPARRLSIKTFVQDYRTSVIREAVLREIMRGGQVFFLHNKVQTIDKMARDLVELIPEAKIEIAHGQMHERQLENVMSDFYHQQFNVLVCTTIIESGIDIPTANTIIINRADLFGLAQLHQLRGRVGRSHHQAYAYLLTPPDSIMTKNAQKRLEAITSLQDLGAGFTLATHDLEIRGAGELLGDEQSGHIQTIGFSLYMDLLDRAVKALKKGKTLKVEDSLKSEIEINLSIPALLPQDYVFDAYTRLTFYKRISSANLTSELQELKEELIDRFGKLPIPTINLFRIAQLKLIAAPLGVESINRSSQTCRIEFNDEPKISVEKLLALAQKEPARYQFEGSKILRFKLTGDQIKDWIDSLVSLFKHVRHDHVS